MSDNLDKELDEIMGLVNKEYPKRTTTTTTARTKSAPRYQSNNSNRVRRVSKRRKQILTRRWAIIGVAVVILVLSIVLIFKACSGSDTSKDNPKDNVASSELFLGKWDTDGSTFYQFAEDGKGTIIQPNATFGFTYEIKGDQLMIDYEPLFMNDCTYTFEFSNEKLILKGGEGTIGGTYELTKVENE